MHDLIIIIIAMTCLNAGVMWLINLATPAYHPAPYAIPSYARGELARLGAALVKVDGTRADGSVTVIGTWDGHVETVHPRCLIPA